MVSRRPVSVQTRNNWLVDATLFTAALVAMVSGIYFLYFPSGGYEGGRNPGYGVVILFGRATWEDLHAWGGLVMIGAVAVHLVLHWSWVTRTTRRLWQKARGSGSGIARAAWISIIVDGLTTLGFLGTAVSGLYFFFLTSGGYQGGRNPQWDPGLLFSRPIWDLVHTWSAILLTAMALVHIWIHWRWIVKVTAKMWRSGRSVLRPS